MAAAVLLLVLLLPVATGVLLVLLLVGVAAGGLVVFLCRNNRGLGGGLQMCEEGEEGGDACVPNNLS